MKSQKFLNRWTSVLITVAIFMCMPGLIEAQNDESKEKPVKVAIKPIAHLKVSELKDVINMFEVHTVIRPSTNTIVLKGDPEGVERALRLLETLDQPVAALEVTVFVVEASKTDKGNGSVPKELASAVSQLKGVFGYSHFSLLNAVSLQTLHGGSGLVGGVLALKSETEDDVSIAGFEVRFSSARVIPEEEHTIVRFDDLTFDVQNRPTLKTDIEIREGQKAVVGRSSPMGIDLVLIIETKIKSREK